MQANVVGLIRDLMQTQQLSIRKISAQIAKEHGGSELGYTQQINRVLNDPDYDPNFSTVEKILSALNCSFWQVTGTARNADLSGMEMKLDHLSDEIADLKQSVNTLQQAIATIMSHLEVPHA